ncbi:MAG: METTL5 family protein [Candidatus Bathyarchaeia archaeon]
MDCYALLTKRKELEFILSRVEPHLTPKLSLEQYTTPPRLAALLLYTAAYTFNDIVGKRVCDLGCGVGRLAIGAAYLGAREVLAIDLDKQAVYVAKRYAQKFGLPINWIVGDISIITGTVDTVIQNPPFGVRRRGADTRFLKKAFEIGEIVYSIHKSGENNRRYLAKVAEVNGRKVQVLFEAQLEIPYQFKFHRKPRYKVKVDIYRITR